MSGIVGSRLNIRGSGLVGSLGTDGQVFTSSGAGVGAAYEAAAGGGKMLQVQMANFQTTTSTTSNIAAGTAGSMTASYLTDQITPSSSDSKILVQANFGSKSYIGEAGAMRGRFQYFRQIDGGGFSVVWPTNTDDEQHYFYIGSGGVAIYWANMMFLDSPNTTTAVDYTMYLALGATGGNYALTVGSYDYTDSQIILTEIDGS